MDKLQKKLLSKLLENPSVQIKKAVIWHIPMTNYTVAFHRVKRSKMDILMKMMLLTFEQAQIRRAANLAEMLLVEELFIEDLLKKMQRTGLIRLETGSYKLTSKGQGQIKTGVMEEELEEESAVLSYSTIHDEFWPERTDPLPESDEVLPVYRYANDQNFIDADRILHVLAERRNSVDEDGFQIIVAAVNSFEEQEVENITFLEFQLYNKEQDIYYARVWNTWLGRWDETLEKQIEDKERLEWRK
ncbi:hypothetical protein [Mesobacillus harenae]|uniref:hypothetical protein n=1 Tax=Mesobacillus harenae TaxID=2213203 RepID=UPI001580C38A|nr:hypothetical protein [Mesobacillus harenae]